VTITRKGGLTFIHYHRKGGGVQFIGGVRPPKP
jgi:hypothetical protein